MASHMLNCRRGESRKGCAPIAVAAGFWLRGGAGCLIIFPAMESAVPRLRENRLMFSADDSCE